MESIDSSSRKAVKEVPFPFPCDGSPASLDQFDEVVFGIEVVGAAVGKEGVDECVVRAGFEAAEEHPVFQAELGGAALLFSNEQVANQVEGHCHRGNF